MTMGQKPPSPVNDFLYSMPSGADEMPPMLVNAKEPPSRKKEQTSSTEYLSSSENSENTRREIWGYRVQIYLSLQQDDAENVANAARGKIDEKVFVEFDPPYYKVRIGNCTNSEDVEELLNKVKRAGYPDAWVVRAKIISEDNR